MWRRNPIEDVISGLRPEIQRMILEAPRALQGFMVGVARKHPDISPAVLAAVVRRRGGVVQRREQRLTPTREEFDIARRMTGAMLVGGAADRVAVWFANLLPHWRTGLGWQSTHEDVAFYDVPGFGRWPLDRIHMHAGDTVREIIDWVDQTNADITSYTWPDAIRASEEWHEALAEQEAAGQKYTTKDVVYRFKDGWTIQRLQSKEDYAAEGAKMAHCVAGYHDHDSVILSLRDPQNEPHVTIEVRPSGFVQQIKGLKNADPPARAYVDRVNEFFRSAQARKLNLSFSIHDVDTDGMILDGGGTRYDLPTITDAAYFKDFLSRVVDRLDRRSQGADWWTCGRAANASEGLAQIAYASDLAIFGAYGPASDKGCLRVIFDQMDDAYSNVTEACAYGDTGVGPMPDEADFTSKREFRAAFNEWEKAEREAIDECARSSPWAFYNDIYEEYMRAARSDKRMKGLPRARR